MSAFMMASTGGAISFLATSAGALLGYFSTKTKDTDNPRWSLSIDFALGLMIAAAAFSLIGPAAVDARVQGFSGAYVLIAALCGGLFVSLFHQILTFFNDRPEAHSHMPSSKRLSSRIILVSVLMLHNFPEGIASGAALGGLGWLTATPILGGIAIQNIPEGSLMVLCLLSMGTSRFTALLGGIGSGLVELFGGVLAGLLLQSLTGVLPLILSFAGGAMIASVVVEFIEGHQEVPVLQRLMSSQFVLGFLFLAIIQFAIG